MTVWLPSAWLSSIGVTVTSMAVSPGVKVTVRVPRAGSNNSSPGRPTRSAARRRPRSSPTSTTGGS
ncbi:hypothetical protein [Fimbriiglobus ruber]|uniref:hypothetical protein n=1 Tax=Fimbriiglobus ruber TaxID=1908690 RepID=UPI000B4BA9C0|nr:hypothetical protein [Fimbriiglobus ruber]